MPLIFRNRDGDALGRLIGKLMPTVDWTFDETSAPIRNIGSAGAAYDLTAGRELGSPVFQVPGPIPKDNAVRVEGKLGPTEGWYLDPTVDFSAFDITSGAIIAVFRPIGGLADGNPSDNNTLFSGFRSSRNSEVFLYTDEPGDARLRFELENRSGSLASRLETDLQHGMSNAWCVVIVRQKADGTGPELFVQGKIDQAGIQTVINEVNSWLDEPRITFNWDAFSVGYRAASGTDGSSGGSANQGASLEVARLTFTTIAPTDLEIAQLTDLYIGARDSRLITGVRAYGESGNFAPATFETTAAPDFTLLLSGQNQAGSITGVHDLEISGDGRFMAHCRGDNNANIQVQMGEWSDSLQAWRPVGDNFASRFVVGVPFGRDPDGVVCAALALLDTRIDIAQWDGSSFVVQAGAVDVQPDGFANTGAFYASASAPAGTDDRLVIGQNREGGGVSLRVYDRVSSGDWNYNASRVDTQPLLGASGADVQDRSLECNGVHVAVICQRSSSDEELRIYEIQPDGDLNTVAVRSTGTTGGIAAEGNGLSFSADGRFLYICRQETAPDVYITKCFDRDNNWNEVSLSLPTNANRDVACSPDGRFVAFAQREGSGNFGTTMFYEINSDGTLTFVDRPRGRGSSATPNGERCVDWKTLYVSGSVGFDAAVAAVGVPDFWYRFRDAATVENEGTQALGDVTAQTHGEAFNGTLTEGQLGGAEAVKFNGGGFLNQNDNEWSGQFGTVFFLFRRQPGGTVGGQWVWGKAFGFDQDNIQFRLMSDGQWRLFRADDNGLDTNLAQDPADYIVDDDWHSLCFVQPSANVIPTVYQDGVELSNLAYFPDPGTPANYWFGDVRDGASCDCQFGARGGVSSSDKFQGLLDEWLYYDSRVLTAQEVLQLHNGAFA